MNTTFSAAVATERQHQLIAEADAYRRSHKSSRRFSAFLKDLAAAGR
jgi:hypothetical protein